ncbi:MAG: DUF4178 domain-containing protein [Pseudomonadota bacterium]
MARYTCENCGAPIDRRIETSRVVACGHCQTTQIFVDEAFKTAGEAGAMHDAPCLLALGRESVIDGHRLTPIGHLRFSYGPGWWDEFWCTGRAGNRWVSADEGDIAIESPLPDQAWPRAFTPKLGASVEVYGERFVVTEAENASCIALRGELPEAITLGETHLYFDLSGEDGGILTFERWDGGEAWFQGRWIDPWRLDSDVTLKPGRRSDNSDVPGGFPSGFSGMIPGDGA